MWQIIRFKCNESTRKETDCIYLKQHKKTQRRERRRVAIELR